MADGRETNGEVRAGGFARLVPFQGTLALSSCRVDGLLVMVQAWPLEVVEVGRQPEVFVRPLEPDEAQRLVKVARTTRDRVRLR